MPVLSRPRPGAARRALTRLALAGSLSLIAGTAILAQPPPAMASLSPHTVAERLGATNIPSELVILVDNSQSMGGTDGLYYKVQAQLSIFLKAIAHQDPNVTVDIKTFSSMEDITRVFRGHPKSNTKIKWPALANAPGSDFGAAFQSALSDLADPPPHTEAGGIILVSDGQLYTKYDRQFRTYHSPGWKPLQYQASHDGLPISGFQIPVTNSQTNNNVTKALSELFPHQVNMFSSTDVGLKAEFQNAESAVIARQVAVEAKPDIGHGVRATWIGLPGYGGNSPLNLSSGQTTAELELTATTRKIPLTVSDLTVSASGFRVPVSASVQYKQYAVAPGHPAKALVTFTWRPQSAGHALFGGSVPDHGQLKVTGTVSSPYTGDIRIIYHDKAFYVGTTLKGELNPQMTAGIHKEVEWLYLLLALLIFLALGVGIMYLVRFFLTRMSGQLAFTSVDRHVRTLPLPSRPGGKWSTKDLVNAQGSLSVTGLARGKKVRIRLKLEQGEEQDFTLAPGEERMVEGIEISYRAQAEAGPPPEPVSGPEPMPEPEPELEPESESEPESADAGAEYGTG